MKALKITTLTLLAFGSGFLAYVFSKKKEVDDIKDKLKFTISGIQNFKINMTDLSADLFFKIQNTSAKSLNLSSGFVKLETLRVFDRTTNKLLAVSDLHIDNVSLPAGGFYNIPKIEIKIPLITGALIALTQLANSKQEFTERLTYELDVTAFNNKQTINF